MKELCLVAILIAAAACQAEPRAASKQDRKGAPAVLRVGQIRHVRLSESSGIVASRKYPGIFWTHNDGGGRKQVLYAIRRTGEHVSEFRVVDAAIEDWEDIAADEEGHLFLADTGNNNLKRTQVAVYQVNEPDLADAATSVARVTRGWQLRFPRQPLDCESLLVWRGFGYLISKVVKDARAEVYRFPLNDQKAPIMLEFVTQLKIESPVAGADISRDGRVLALVAKSGAFAWTIDGDVRRSGDAKPYHRKFKGNDMEACTFVPEGLLTTAESREIHLFTDSVFVTQPAPASEGR